MIFRKRIQEMPAKTMTQIGMSLCLFGMFLSMIGTKYPLGLPDFWQGFMLGFGAVMMGTSIVFNMRGLMKFREERDR